jgi:hypothetical protein
VQTLPDKSLLSLGFSPLAGDFLVGFLEKEESPIAVEYAGDTCCRGNLWSWLPQKCREG